MENKINNLETRIERLEKCGEKQEDKMDTIEKKVLEISIGSKKDFDLIFTMLQEIKESVDTMQKKPGIRWESAMSTVIKVITTAAVTYIITKGAI